MTGCKAMHGKQKKLGKHTLNLNETMKTTPEGRRFVRSGIASTSKRKQVENVHISPDSNLCKCALRIEM